MRAHGKPFTTIAPRRSLAGNHRWAERKQAAMVRDGHQCRFCARKSTLQVHHIDGRGTCAKVPNHDLSNLITLCTRCHHLVHTEHLAVTPDLLALVDARCGIKPINLPGSPSYQDREHLLRPHKAALVSLPG